MNVLELKRIMKPAVEAVGLVFLGVEWVPDQQGGVIRLYIDSASGVTAEDCSRASAQVSAALDIATEMEMPSRYRLEVSSPGLDRPLFELDQFQAQIGQVVRVRMRVTQSGQKNFTGCLKSIVDDQVVMELENGEVRLPYADIAKANVVAKW